MEDQGMDAARQAILAAAKLGGDGYWQKHSVSDADDLNNQREELLSQMVRIMSAEIAATQSGNTNLAKIHRMARHENIRALSRVDLGHELYDSAQRVLKGILDPQSELAEDDRIQAMIASIAEPGDDGTPYPKRTTAEVGYNGLGGLQHTVASIFNPTKIGGEVAEVSNIVGQYVAGIFTSKIAMNKAQLAAISDPEERKVAERKLFIQAFEEMAENLPPAFVRGNLNHHMELMAQEAGFAVRMKPETTVTDAQSQARVQGDERTRGF